MALGSRLHVAMLVRELPVGGLENVVISLANGLHGAGAGVKVVVVEAGDNALIGELDPGIVIIHLSGGPVTRVRQLRREVRGHVSHVHFSEGRVGPMIRLALPVPTVVTYHNTYTRHRLVDFVDRICAHRAEELLAVSNDVLNYCRSIGLPDRKLSVIHNGVSRHHARPASSRKPHDCLAVARLVPQKDFPTLLRGFALAVEEVESLRLTIVGDGQERRQLRALAQELGLGRRVRWVGQVTDMDRIDALRAKTAIFISASRWEGFSLSVLEAMLFGQLAVASDIPPHREALGDGAVYFPVGDEAALARGLVELTKDSGLGDALLQTASERVTRFRDTSTLDGYVQVYRRLSQPK